MCTDSAVASKEAAGAPEAKTEIEITPEMVSNVAAVISAADYRFESVEDVAIEVIAVCLNKARLE